LLKECFERYVSWVFDNVSLDSIEEYDLLALLAESNEGRLQQVESFLDEARKLLRMDVSEFIRAFGFTTDLLVDDPEHIYDILAEPQVVLELDRNGFSRIKKIPRSIKVHQREIPTADFIAERIGITYAIEVKTIRMERGIQEGVPIGNGTIPYWWQDMMLNNAITKIEDKNRRVISQLDNTAQQYNCQLKMIVLYTRRVGLSTLLSEQEANLILSELSNSYPEIDKFMLRLITGEVFFYPPHG
jgi:hypothetical protein